ncbi:leucine-rich repeat protein [Clostridioides difficile]|uniref:hypothetical protein n=1 Tax=Clostridioides difficile TaxID=1496 RepID=UPI000D1F4465|nr:hypothetical protein [Clostridioides difficile]UWD40470.1 hypothetical protein NYF05_14055 [Clostridioides difficile]UWD44254.1 hypothetical protein NYU56_13815 [Clostridioides difficile]VFF94815.1 leucine-rich repeat protein [Clostridioides difficile]VIG12767.1 leucine-rich repeat protein [Clostridioides difficile]HBE9437493.1 hypothetical protein [Clostridioides difficile]
MKNKRINSILSIIMTTVIISLSFVTTANSMEKIESDNNIKIELSDKEVEELHNYWPEDKVFSDEKIDEILIKTGQFTQEELDKINQEVDDYAKKVNQNSRVKYINVYNKYRTFVKNGKKYLYIYVSGKTLKKIKAGADLASTFGGFLPKIWVGLAVVVIGKIITTNMNGINTNYGIVLSYIEDKWNFQGVTYTYRYDHWFYQT